jgi:hypothetical protein
VDSQHNMNQDQHQDWAPLTISRSGAVKPSTKPLGAPPGPTAKPKVSAEARQKAKIADADGPTKQKVLAPESRQAIINFRVGPDVPVKRTQAELNTLCRFPPNTIRDIEAGKLTPSIGQLNVLNQVLKTGLRLI